MRSNRGRRIGALALFAICAGLMFTQRVARASRASRAVALPAPKVDVRAPSDTAGRRQDPGD